MQAKLVYIQIFRHRNPIPLFSGNFTKAWSRKQKLRKQDSILVGCILPACQPYPMVFQVHLWRGWVPTYPPSGLMLGWVVTHQTYSPQPYPPTGHIPWHNHPPWHTYPQKRPGARDTNPQKGHWTRDTHLWKHYVNMLLQKLVMSTWVHNFLDI